VVQVVELAQVVELVLEAVGAILLNLNIVGQTRLAERDYH